MNDNALNSPTDPRPLGGMKATVLCVVGLAAFTLVAAALPARVKLLGLFPVVFAALVGYVFGRVAALAGLQRRGVLIPLTTIVIVAGLAGYYGESYRRWRNDRERFYLDHIGGQPGGEQILQRLQGNMLSPDPIIRQFDTQYFALLHPSFSDYLEQRVALLQIAGWRVDVAPPWPKVLFGAELILGTAAGLWAASVATKRPHPQPADRVTA